MDGVYTSIQEPSRNESVSVGTSSVVLSPPRNGGNKRKAVWIRNNSSAAADIITVVFGNATAVANAGIILKQNESFYDANDSGYESWQGSITAVCATANGTVALFER